jgi:hypothetical protein
MISPARLRHLAYGEVDSPSRLRRIAYQRALARLRIKYHKQFCRMFDQEAALLGLPRIHHREPRRLTADEELAQMYGV